VSLTLVTLPDGHQLDAGAAASYLRMSGAYGSLLPVTSAYRSTTEQARLRAGWLAHLPGFNFALPAGSSVHELGRAVDFGQGAYGWLEVYAGLFGWHRTNPAERWHYEYDLTRDRHLADVGPAPRPPAPAAPAVTTPNPFTEDTMDRLVIALFRTLLGRAPSDVEVDSFLTQAAANSWTPEQVYAQVYGSAEAIARRG
jgi:hypothetical protein